MELSLSDASALGAAATSATPLVSSAPPLVPGAAPSEALGGGSGQKATPAATGVVPITWLAAAPVPPVPAPEGAVATVNDRRVRLGPASAPEEQQPSLYRLCRQWVQNDPDLSPPLADPLPASKLPPLAPRSDEATALLQQPTPVEAPLPGSTAAPSGEGAAAAGAAAGGHVAAAEAGGSGASGGGAEPPATDALMRHHMHHWAAVRRHKKAQAAAATQRHAQRLQAFMALGGGAAAVPVAMQQ